MYFSLGVAITLILNVVLDKQPGYIILLIVLLLQSIATIFIPLMADSRTKKNSTLIE